MLTITIASILLFRFPGGLAWSTQVYYPRQAAIGGTALQLPTLSNVTFVLALDNCLAGQLALSTTSTKGKF